MVVLPMSAMALTTVSDSELAGVTGQAGVSINVDMTANITVGTLAWGDADGFSGNTNAGYVGLTGMTFTTTMHPRTDVPIERQMFLNIDVAGGTTPTVRIGLPTGEIGVSALQTDAFVSGVGSDGAPTNMQVLGHIYVGGMTVKLGREVNASAHVWSAGYIAISSVAGTATTSQGVRIDIQPIIGEVAFGALSWGNDGVSGVYGEVLSDSALVTGITGTAAGFVGVRDLRISNVAINGAVQISVGQSSLVNYVTTSLGKLAGAIPAAAPELTMQSTMVQILFESGFTVSVGSVTGNVVLSADRALNTGSATTTQVLGNFYVGGVVCQIVDNAARDQLMMRGAGGLYNIKAHPSVIQIVAH
jgi:hypothetical protein